MNGLTFGQEMSTAPKGSSDTIKENQKSRIAGKIKHKRMIMCCVFTIPLKDISK